jgi:hypothetical protein
MQKINRFFILLSFGVTGADVREEIQWSGGFLVILCDVADSLFYLQRILVVIASHNIGHPTDEICHSALRFT